MINVAEDIQLRPLSAGDASDIFRVLDEEREYMREWLPFDGELLVDNRYTDINVYSLLKREYKA